MENLESLLWIPAIISAVGVGVVITKEYINGHRMEKQIEEQNVELQGLTNKTIYNIENLTLRINQKYH